MAERAVFNLRLLGTFVASLHGRPLPDLRARKEQWLLALLVLQNGIKTERDWLAATLWPESDPEQALRNLRNILMGLRRALGSEAGRLQAPTPRTLALDLTEASVDLLAFECCVRLGDEASLQQAVALYRGPLLDGCGEAWVLPERQRRELEYLQALETLATAQLSRGEPGAAEPYLRLAVAVDPLRESAQRTLIQALAESKSFAAALHVYRELRLRLHRELNTEPDAATTALFRSLRDRAQRARSRLEERPTEDAKALSRPQSELCLPSNLQPDLEPAGGAVPLGSPFYVTRTTDVRFAEAVARQESIVLVKGSRQVGKSSLLARGLHRARQQGRRVILTPLELFQGESLVSADAFLLALALSVAEQLEIQASPADDWDRRRGASSNFQRFMRRQVLPALTAPLVWGLDDVDHLFDCSWSAEVFSLFRVWHNERALDPAGPWSQLTLAMAYATEAHLFIPDLNQSPFNVGTRLTLDDFTSDQVAELNQRHGGLLAEEELARFRELVGGHPYLVRAGLNEVSIRGSDLSALATEAVSDDGIYGGHLQRLLERLVRDSELTEVMRGVLAGRACPTHRSFYRLRSAGLVTGDSPGTARPRCELYAAYLRRHLG